MLPSESNCALCGDELVRGEHESLSTGNHICRRCARGEIVEILRDCDPQELMRLRRRIEDRIRKSPHALRVVAAELILAGEIEF